MTALGIWVAAFFTLCIYSFLYKDNPLYKFAEHLFVGVSTGYGIAFTFHKGFIPYVWQPLTKGVQGDYIQLLVIIPILLGLLFFARFTPRHSWLVRYPIAFLLGVGSGVAIPLTLQTYILEQVHGTLTPFGQFGNLNGWAIFGAIFMLVGVVCTLTYFFFSVEHRGPVGLLSRIGIVFLMIGFGSAFGNTVMGRVSLLIERVDFLLRDWLHLLS